jgi:hypothetical protein
MGEILGRSSEECSHVSNRLKRKWNLGRSYRERRKPSVAALKTLKDSNSRKEKCHSVQC